MKKLLFPENIVDRKLTVIQIQALTKIINYSLAAILFISQNVEVREKIQNLIHGLSRLNKIGLEQYFVKYISKQEIESIQNLIIFSEPYIEEGYRLNKLASKMKDSWYKAVNEITNYHSRWLSL